MTHDTELAMLAGATALVAGMAGWLALHLLRRRSVGVQVVVVAVTSVAAVALGARVAVRSMLLSDDDLSALDAVVLAAGSVGILTALLLGRRVMRAGASLVEDARAVGAEGAPPPGPRADAPRELSRLAAELDDASTRLREAREREQALDRSRRELVAWVSHDLRTPLAGIMAVAEALDDGVVSDPETITRYHRTLRDEAERLALLVDDLFELSRTQAGVLRLDLVPLSISDLVSDALSAAAPVADAAGIRLDGRVDGRPPEVAASAPELLRALRNVLDNAIRHTPAGGAVTVEVAGADDAVEVVVTDTGGGIAEADLARVFDVAFRGDPARTKGDGAGLGLAIARSLVEAHGGQISVRNVTGEGVEPGGGATGACVTIRLPALSAAG